jgi:hypothetical protein
MEGPPERNGENGKENHVLKSWTFSWKAWEVSPGSRNYSWRSKKEKKLSLVMLGR